MVVFLTTIITSTSPQRPAEPSVPVNDLRTVVTFFFGVALAWVTAFVFAVTA